MKQNGTEDILEAASRSTTPFCRMRRVIPFRSTGSFLSVRECVLLHIALILLSGILAGCVGRKSEHQMGDHQAMDTTAMPLQSIEEVLQAHADSLMGIPGVVGTAQSLCEGKPCIKIFIERQTQETQHLPERLGGYLVVIEQSGTFRALPRRGT